MTDANLIGAPEDPGYAVRVWREIWQSGDAYNFSGDTEMNYIYPLGGTEGGVPWTVKSLVVANGWRAQIRAGRDGKGHRSPYFEAGTYNDLSFYQMRAPSEDADTGHVAYIKDGDGNPEQVTRTNKDWCLVISKVEYHENALALFWDTTPYWEGGRQEDYGAVWKTPPGACLGAKSYRYALSRVGYVTVPKWGNMYLYTTDDFSDTPVHLYGGTEGRTFNLADYGMNNKLRGHKMYPDGIEMTQVMYDYSEAKWTDPETVALDQLIVSNENPPPEIDREPIIEVATVSFSEEIVTATAWETLAHYDYSIALGAEGELKLEVEPFGIGGDVTGKLSFGWGYDWGKTYGTSGSKSEAKIKSASVLITLGPQQSCVAQLQALMQTVSGVKMVRTFKNSKTGESFTDESILSQTSSLQVNAVSLPLDDNADALDIFRAGAGTEFESSGDDVSATDVTNVENPDH